MTYTYQTPSEAGYNLTAGANKYFAWLVSSDSTFISQFLLFVWAVILMGGTFTESKITNRTDLIKWGFLSSIITLGLALIITIQTDFVVDDWILLILIATTILTAIILFAGKKIAEI